MKRTETPAAGRQEAAGPWVVLARALMGSTAEGVMRKAPCPVLTVKAPFPDGRTPSASAAEAVVPWQAAERCND